jgi:hypothetical protein
MNRIKNFNKFKLYEFEEVPNLPSADRVLSMDKLYQRIKKDIKPNISDKFNIDYDRGKSITIKTDNPKDLQITITLDDNKISFLSKPALSSTSGPEFEFEFDFSERDINTVIKLVKKEFDDDPNGGLSYKGKDTYKSDTDEQSDDIRSEDIDINTPITKKPLRRKRSININIIKNVLEDAFIIDDIDLKDTSVQELIRRMLLETRK